MNGDQTDLFPPTIRGGQWVCGRCGGEGATLTVSYFGTNLICPRRERIERAHPR